MLLFNLHLICKYRDFFSCVENKQCGFALTSREKDTVRLLDILALVHVRLLISYCYGIHLTLHTHSPTLQSLCYYKLSK